LTADQKTKVGAHVEMLGGPGGPGFGPGGPGPRPGRHPGAPPAAAPANQ
jgi:hypothetical protein